MPMYVLGNYLSPHKGHDNPHLGALGNVSLPPRKGTAYIIGDDSPWECSGRTLIIC